VIGASGAGTSAMGRSADADLPVGASGAGARLVRALRRRVGCVQDAATQHARRNAAPRARVRPAYLVPPVLEFMLMTILLAAAMADASALRLHPMIAALRPSAPREGGEGDRALPRALDTQSARVARAVQVVASRGVGGLGDSSRMAARHG
jgi:hypothetical protein